MRPVDGKIVVFYTGEAVAMIAGAPFAAGACCIGKAFEQTQEEEGKE